MKRFMAILLAGMLSLSAAVPSFAAVATNAGKWAKLPSNLPISRDF